MQDQRTESAVELSVVIVLSDPRDGSGFMEVFHEYDRQLASMGTSYEMVVVLATQIEDSVLDSSLLRSKNARVTVLHLSTTLGESTALAAGIAEAAGDVILTLPSRMQIASEAIPNLISSLKSNDMVIVRRWPRVDGRLNRIQTQVFHFVLRIMLKKFSFHDLGCSVRLFKRRVIDQIHLYGDQHRFFPILAARSGFKVSEIDIPQADAPLETKLYTPGVYLRRVLDLVTIFFLVKFTQKPLRFFGLSGFVIFFTGGLLTAYLAFERIYLGVPLADRPVLLLGLLLIVLGIQFFAFGLIGELIIFLHSKELKTYSVERTIN